MKNLPLIVLSILFVGCNSESSAETKSPNSSKDRVEINRVEKHIANSNSSIGCEGKSKRECSEHEDIDSAGYILSALNQQQKKSEIRDGLENLVERSDRAEIKKDLSKLVAKSSDTIEDEHDKKIATPPKIEKDIKLIKDSLEELVNSSDHKKALKIKRDIDRLVEESVDKKDVLRTKKTLERLVDEIEQEKSKKKRQTIKAIINDIATKKINLIDETDEYFIIEVKKGDTLSILAKRYYGDGSKFRLIYEANKDKIGSKFEIYPGTKLKIPKI